jgi:hypothetical protein
MTITALTEIPASDRDNADRTHYRTTVPESVVELLELEDRRVKWQVTDDGTVELRAVREE